MPGRSAQKKQEKDTLKKLIKTAILWLDKLDKWLKLKAKIPTTKPFETQPTAAKLHKWFKD